MPCRARGRHSRLKTALPPKPTARIVMIRHGATYSAEDGLLLGRKDEALTPLGEVQANKTAELLMDMKVGI